MENPDAASTGNLSPVTGEISGDMIGKVAVEGLSNNEITTTTKITISGINGQVKSTADDRMSSVVVSSASVNVPSAILVFFPDAASDVASLSYVGHDVNKEDFVAYINNNRVNKHLKEYTISDSVTSNVAYKDFQEDQYGWLVYNTFNTNALVAKLAGMLSTADSLYTAGESTSSATFTITNEGSTPATFVEVADPEITYAIPSKGSIVVTFEGENGTDAGTF